MPLTLLPPKERIPELTFSNTEVSQRARPALVDTAGHEIELPEEILDLLAFVTNAWQQGQGVTITTKSEMLTTQEAADLIGCSRQHVVSLMNSGHLPGRKIGTHRRLSLEDVLHFIQTKERKREKPPVDEDLDTQRLPRLAANSRSQFESEASYHGSPHPM